MAAWENGTGPLPRLSSEMRFLVSVTSLSGRGGGSPTNTCYCTATWSLLGRISRGLSRRDPAGALATLSGPPPRHARPSKPHPRSIRSGHSMGADKAHHRSQHGSDNARANGGLASDRNGRMLAARIEQGMGRKKEWDERRKKDMPHLDNKSPMQAGMANGALAIGPKLPRPSSTLTLLRSRHRDEWQLPGSS
jgi:hypothetical protein